jgi:hypothetical protein
MENTENQMTDLLSSNIIENKIVYVKKKNKILILCIILLIFVLIVFGATLPFH